MDCHGWSLVAGNVPFICLISSLYCQVNHDKHNAAHPASDHSSVYAKTSYCAASNFMENISVEEIPQWINYLHFIKSGRRSHVFQFQAHMVPL